VNSGDDGYVLIIEEEAEFKKLTAIYFRCRTVIPEYVDIIACGDGK